MEREPSRRRFITGCCVAGAGALAAGGLAGGAAAAGDERAAQPKTRWNRTYETGNGGTASAIAPADDGYVVVGTTEPSKGENESVIWLSKLSPAGRIIWERTFAERTVTEGFDIAEADEGYIVAGHTRDGGSDGQDAVALRVDAEGVEQWRRVFHVRDSTTDTMRAVEADSDGRFVFAGWTSRFNDAWVARLTDENKIDWAHRYGPGSRSRYHGVTVDSDGGYVVVGENVDTSGDTAGWANKLDGEGAQQFSQQFKKSSSSATNPYDDYNVFYDVTETRNGFVAVGANAFDPKTNDQRGWAMEFNVNGGKLWDKRYTEDNYTALREVTYDNLEYHVVGETATDGDGRGARGYAAGLGIDGQMKWSGTWGSGSSEFSAFHMNDSNGMISVGSTAESADSTADAWGVQIGGDEVATATPSSTPSPTPSPTAESPTPTFSPTPTDETDGTVATGGGEGTDATAPTSAPDGDETATPGGDGGGPGTTAAAEDGGGLSPTAIGIGAVILAIGGGGVLYNRFLAGDDEDVAGSDQGAGGAAPTDTGDGDDGGGGGAETTEPATDENEDVQSAETVVESSGSTDDAADGEGSSGGSEDAEGAAESDGQDDAEEPAGDESADR